MFDYVVGVVVAVTGIGASLSSRLAMRISPLPICVGSIFSEYSSIGVEEARKGLLSVLIVDPEACDVLGNSLVTSGNAGAAIS